MNIGIIQKNINALAVGEYFEMTDVVPNGGSTNTNKKLGKKFKELVLNGTLINVEHVGLTNNRHDEYRRI